MNDQQPYSPPEPPAESSNSGRRRAFGRTFGCLVLIVVVIAAYALILTLARRDADGRAITQQIVAPGKTTPAAVEQPTTESAEFESAVTSGEPVQEEPPSSPSSDAPEQEASGTAEASAMEPPTAATAEPTAAATNEPPTVEAGPTDPPLAEPAETDDAQRLGDGRIAVVDTLSRLWTVKADGSDRRLLSETGRFYQFPSWSPAGNDIAVIGSDFDGSGVYVVTDGEGAELRQLYADNAERPIYLYWAPGGESVSFIASHPDGLALHLARKDGSFAPDLLATSPSTFFWDWLPDGSQVLIHTGFTARNSDNSRLAFVPLDSALQATEIVQRGFFQAPAVAFDGRFYSYSDEDPAGRRWLSIQDIDSGQQVELVFHRGVVAMGFSPTRAQLAYTSPQRPALSFYGPLRLLDLDSGQARMLVPETVLAYFWSPDGRSIAYLTLTEIDDPLDFDNAPVAARPGLAKARTLSKAQPPPDSESKIGLALWVIDVDSGASRRLAVFEPSDIFLDQFLPFFDQYALSHRLWSPDSKALVMPMKDESGRDFIVVVPADGSAPLTIAHGVVAFWSHQ